MANKAALIERVAEKTGLTKKDATVAVDAVFETIQDALVDGEKVQLRKKQKQLFQHSQKQLKKL